MFGEFLKRMLDGASLNIPENFRKAREMMNTPDPRGFRGFQSEDNRITNDLVSRGRLPLNQAEIFPQRRAEDDALVQGPQGLVPMSADIAHLRNRFPLYQGNPQVRLGGNYSPQGGNLDEPIELQSPGDSYGAFQNAPGGLSPRFYNGPENLQGGDALRRLLRW